MCIRDRAWLEGLRQYLQMLQTHDTPIVVLGDFNIAPHNNDVHDPLAWEGQVLVSEREREAWQALLNLGLVDIYRTLDPVNPMYTWWDYRQMAFRRNHGLRIDHILVSKSLAPQCKNVCVDKDARKHERPSDHAPVLLTLAWP